MYLTAGQLPAGLFDSRYQWNVIMSFDSYCSSKISICLPRYVEFCVLMERNNNSNNM